MVQDISASIEACAAHYGEDADAVRDYLTQGQARALALPNRGTLKFDADGTVHSDILEAYAEYGFYVFEKALSAEELADLQSDMATELANGRHQVKLFEPKAKSDAPAASPFYLAGSLQFSPACLRLYAHPGLLKMAEAVNGSDFTPFHEGLFIKDAGLGAAVSWHQDGDTHWDNPDFDADIHGFNFMGQIYGSTAVNGVWVVPGSHKDGRADIVKLVADAGTERLPDAVPIICNPGDVVINNRQLVHGSFANTGFEPRVTANFGFHRRSSVLNVKGAGIHAEAAVFDEAFIAERSRVMGLAIAARQERFPNETPYAYQPLADIQNTFQYNPAAQAALLDYNLMDLSI